ncbi:MAG: amino acid permease [Acidobacteriota bacterium]|nr:amino acid permease [Acidobacteriota bacterium]
MTGAAHAADSKSQASGEGQQPTLVRGLTLVDSVLLLVGGIIGSAIFLAVKDTAAPLPHPLWLIAVWVVGGAITLLACFAFAELGAMYPDSGGQYVYLREAYGDLAAFLFGWMVITVNFSGTIAALAVGFAAYSEAIIPYGADKVLLAVGSWSLTRAGVLAIVAIGVLTWVNVIGLRRAATMQNIATWTKFGAIAIFVVLGVTIGRGSWSHFTAVAPLPTADLFKGFGVALIAVFFAYDGWNYITCAAGEVKDPQKNIPLALVLGVLAVGAVYISMIVVYLYALPIERVASEATIANTAAISLFSPAVGRWVSVLIAVSCFGAASACTLAGARVVYAMGRDGVFFRAMGYVHPKYRTPSLALIAQGIWSAVLAVSGRYDQLYTYVIFVGVLMYTLTVGAVFILRHKRPDAPRPYRCTWYPFAPAAYIVLSLIWCGVVVFQRPKEAAAGTLIVLLGIPAYLYFKRKLKTAA